MSLKSFGNIFGGGATALVLVGSESAVWTQNSSKSKGADESDNDTDSQDDDDSGSIGLNARDGSDNGSGSPANAPRLFTQGLRCVTNNWVPLATMKKCGKQADEFDNIAMGKDLKIGVPGIPNLQLNDSCEEVLTNIAGNNGERFCEIKPEQDIGHLEKAQVEIESEVLDIPHSCSSNNKNKVVYESKEMPSLELSLKRLRDIGAAGASSHERNVLRHSAFSRYNSASTPDQAPTGNVVTTILWAQKTNNAFTKPLVIRDKPTPKSTVKCLHPPAFQPVQNDHTPLPQPVIQAAASQCWVI
ncbi:hypothetical protein OIU76_012447 [Salix suchowensis]|nr:hypothetical protein OIU76_012447 [Salix suchowensis]